MAKKKTTKKTARRRRTAPARTPQAVFAEKLMRIRKAAPNPPQTGQYVDGDDVYPFTRAQEVVETYIPLMARENLVMVPGAIWMHERQGWYAVVQKFNVIDIDTGYTYEGEGAGIGTNGSWALLSAQTVARKAFILGLFSLSWTIDLEEQILAAAQEGISRNMPDQVLKSMNDFFDACHAEIRNIPRRMMRNIREARK